LAGGLMPSRYPSRVRQVIPPFALWWVGMVHDHAMWRDDAGFVRRQMGGVRAVIDAFCGFRNADGLVAGPADGWNFVDWVPGWKYGVPPDAAEGVSSVVNGQFVLALTMAAELEEWFGERELAARCRRVAREVWAAVEREFWEPVRGLIADDRDNRHFSEHAQCLAILSGQLDDERGQRVARGLIHLTELKRTTIYFTHYLFEALRAIGTRWPGLEGEATRVLFDRLGLWFELGERGFVTPFEEPEPTRSDCHAWGSHPMFHYLATIAGVRPAGPGFREVDVRPRIGELTTVRATVPHPRGGVISVEVGREGTRVVLPEGVTIVGSARRGAPAHPDGPRKPGG
jgi:hypothetical protein